MAEDAETALSRPDRASSSSSTMLPTPTSSELGESPSDPSTRLDSDALPREPPPPYSPNELFTEVDMGSKGVGLVSTQPIPVGRIIIDELPVLRCPNSISEESLSTLLLLQLRELSKAERNTFFQLPNQYPKLKPLVGIFKSNAHNIGTKGGENGLHLKSARINHSCCANTMLFFDKSTGRQQVMAVRDIAEGEELNTSYLNDNDCYRDRRWRRDVICNVYGFTCQCKACTEGTKADLDTSDFRRLRYWRIHQVYGVQDFTIAYPNTALGYVHEMLKILQQEGEGITRTIALYSWAFDICAMHGDMWRARVFMALVIVQKKLFENYSEAEIEDCVERFHHPEMYRLAFMTRKWAKGNDPATGMTPAGIYEWLWFRAKPAHDGIGIDVNSVPEGGLDRAVKEGLSMGVPF